MLFSSFPRLCLSGLSRCTSTVVATVRRIESHNTGRHPPPPTSLFPLLWSPLVSSRLEVVILHAFPFSLPSNGLRASLKPRLVWTQKLERRALGRLFGPSVPICIALTYPCSLAQPNFESPLSKGPAAFETLLPPRLDWDWDCPARTARPVGTRTCSKKTTHGLPTQPASIRPREERERRRERERDRDDHEHCATGKNQETTRILRRYATVPCIRTLRSPYLLRTSSAPYLQTEKDLQGPAATATDAAQPPATFLTAQLPRRPLVSNPSYTVYPPPARPGPAQPSAILDHHHVGHLNPPNRNSRKPGRTRIRGRLDSGPPLHRLGDTTLPRDALFPTTSPDRAFTSSLFVAISVLRRRRRPCRYRRPRTYTFHPSSL
ncbi:hypothetical protein CDEST_06392 [Colletotrichum destructivum]|uniref:Uncharacterized protein n=1 Tax=Colletotrichum destructivum TaxID=34406 RepID=A0AAX4ID89_9PEZI|nr:hypothetical protein CDEST_06392 [Colletotrichum destructivum]